MQVIAKPKIKQIIIEPDELMTKGTMTVEADLIVGKLVLFGSRPAVCKIKISDKLAELIREDIASQIGEILEDKINGAE